MKYYLKKNLESRTTIGGSNAPNVEDAIFRLHGRVLKNNYKLPSKKKLTTLLDFGCGQGATVNFFNQNGYDAYGIDICENDIEIAKRRYPHIADKFKTCRPDVFKTPITKFTNNKKISLITGHRSLNFLDEEDFNLLLKNFNRSLEPKGLVYASMMSSKSTYAKHSKKTKDNWLREVTFSGKRVKLKKYFEFFCNSKKDVISKFSIFRKVQVGSYHFQLDENDMYIHYYLILCQKK